jgi:hypothetical protein
VVRKVNGRLVIWNKLGNWYNMNEEDSARLLQLHQDFISFAEKLDDHDVERKLSRYCKFVTYIFMGQPQCLYNLLYTPVSYN